MGIVASALGSCGRSFNFKLPWVIGHFLITFELLDAIRIVNICQASEVVETRELLYIVLASRKHQRILFELEEAWSRLRSNSETLVTFNEHYLAGVRLECLLLLRIFVLIILVDFRTQRLLHHMIVVDLQIISIVVICQLNSLSTTVALCLGNTVLSGD